MSASQTTESGTEAPVQEARRLLAAATPGPWRAEHHYQSCRVDSSHYASEVHPILEIDGEGSGGLDREADAELVAAAPELLAALCDEVEQLRAALDATRQETR